MINFFPRKNLSWTAMVQIEKDLDEFIEIYLRGEKRDFKGYAGGREVADALEDGQATGDIEMDMLLAKIPKLEIMDVPFYVEMPDGAGGMIPIVAKPDTMAADMSAFKEYKTSTKPWTQPKVDDHMSKLGGGQITFYNTAMYLKTKKVERDIELVDIRMETIIDGHGRNKSVPTGEITVFRTKRDMKQTLEMMVRMRKAWRLIQEVCEKELF